MFIFLSVLKENFPLNECEPICNIVISLLSLLINTQDNDKKFKYVSFFFKKEEDKILSRPWRQLFILLCIFALTRIYIRLAAGLAYRAGIPFGSAHGIPKRKLNANAYVSFAPSLLTRRG